MSPAGVFVQAGSSLQGVQTAAAGITWDLPYRWTLGSGQLGSNLEVSYAYWHIRSGIRSDQAHLSQWAIVPSLRYRPDEGSPWFVDTGVGLTVTSSIYRSRERAFSTRFNFGTHLAIGRRFGQRAEHEIALRVEHFSNAGIKRPNPGENFIQLRYTRRL
ncbi:Lipid A deacylase (fragment) [Burkholderiales bacterium 8X]